MQSWSAVLSPSATFRVYHEVHPAAASPLLSSGAGEDERGSRREPCFIRNRHLAPALPAAAGPGSGSGWGQEHARVPRQRRSRVGNLHQSPNISPGFYLQTRYWWRENKDIVLLCGRARAARPGSSPSPRGDGELAERAASWRMEITLAATRAGSCSREGRKEAELPTDIGQRNNGRGL